MSDQEQINAEHDRSDREESLRREGHLADGFGEGELDVGLDADIVEFIDEVGQDEVGDAEERVRGYLEPD